MNSPNITIASTTNILFEVRFNQCMKAMTAFLNIDREFAHVLFWRLLNGSRKRLTAAVGDRRREKARLQLLVGHIVHLVAVLLCRRLLTVRILPRVRGGLTRARAVWAW